jgi:hypothetical protein
MNKLKEIFSIVRSLNEDELKTLQRYIHCFDIMNDNHDSKSERLLTLIIHNKASDLRLFEKKFSQQAFSMLVSRLYDKILDSLTFDINVKRPDVYSSLGLTKMVVRKRILYTQALLNKNQIPESLSQYQKIIQAAKEYELYDELLLAMYELQNLYSALSKPAEFDKLNGEIAYYEEVRSQVKKAYLLFNRHMIEKTMSPESTQSIRDLEFVIPQIRSQYLLSKSPLLGWFYYKLLIEFHQFTHQHAEGYNACINLLKIQQESPSIRSEGYLAITYKLMAQFSMMLYRFDDALVNILKAQNLGKNSNHNDNINKEIEFFANFYAGNFAESRYIVKKITDYANKEEQTFNLSKYAYYDACCDLAEGNFSELNLKLNDTKEIEKDREGWNISVRLLAILGHLESEHFDLADSKIESLRKHIERLLKEKEVRQRYITIVKILRDLVNNSFDFQKIWITRSAYFETLYADRDEEYRWAVLSPELIRFEVWFEAKAKGLKYRDLQSAVFEKRKIDAQISNVG